MKTVVKQICAVISTNKNFQVQIKHCEKHTDIHATNLQLVFQFTAIMNLVKSILDVQMCSLSTVICAV